MATVPFPRKGSRNSWSHLINRLDALHLRVVHTLIRLGRIG